MSKSGLPSAWHIWKRVWSSYRAHFMHYSAIVLIVSVPVAILNAVSNNDPTVSAYGSLAALFMNAALIYAIVRSHKHDFRLKIRQLYYEASAFLLRYILVGVLFAVMLIPAALGLGLVGLGGNVGAAPPIGEVALLSLVGLLIGLPSIYLLIRNGLAVVYVFTDNASPMAALRSSRALTAGKFWALLSRYVLMILGLIVLALPQSFILVGLYIVTKSTIFTALYQILNAMVILPLLYLYIFCVYQCLADREI